MIKYIVIGFFIVLILSILLHRIGDFRRWLETKFPSDDSEYKEGASI